MFITRENGVRIVRCKLGCQTVLVRGGKPTDDYAELVIAMKEPNGVLGKHESAVCKSCKVKALAGELDVRSIYAEDLVQEIADTIAAGYKPESYMKQASYMAAREPLRALNVPSRVGAP
jgi:hypothetical protein